MPPKRKTPAASIGEASPSSSPAAKKVKAKGSSGLSGVSGSGGKELSEFSFKPNTPVLEYLPKVAVSIVCKSKRRDEWLYKVRWFFAILFYRLRWFSDDLLMEILQALQPSSQNVVKAEAEFNEFKSILHSLQTAVAATHLAVASKFIASTDAGQLYVGAVLNARKSKTAIPNVSVDSIKQELDLGFSDIRGLWSPIVYAVNADHWSPSGWSNPANKRHFTLLTLASYHLIAQYASIVGRATKGSINTHARVSALKTTSNANHPDAWPNINLGPKTAEAWQEWTEIDEGNQSFKLLLDRLERHEEGNDPEDSDGNNDGVITIDDDRAVPIVDNGEFAEGNGALDENAFEVIKVLDESDKRERKFLTSALKSSSQPDDYEDLSSQADAFEFSQEVKDHYGEMAAPLSPSTPQRLRHQEWPDKTYPEGAMDLSFEKSFIPDIAWQIATLGPMGLAEYCIKRLDKEGEKLEGIICSLKDRQQRNINAIHALEKMVEKMKRDRLVVAKAREDCVGSSQSLFDKRRDIKATQSAYLGTANTTLSGLTGIRPQLDGRLVSQKTLQTSGWRAKRDGGSEAFRPSLSSAPPSSQVSPAPASQDFQSSPVSGAYLSSPPNVTPIQLPPSRPYQLPVNDPGAPKSPIDDPGLPNSPTIETGGKADQ